MTDSVGKKRQWDLRGKEAREWLGLVFLVRCRVA